MNKICKTCNKEFSTVQIINGIKRDLSARVNCLDCVPFGSSLSIVNRVKKDDSDFKSGQKNFYCSRECSLKWSLQLESN